jgi:hypothetical protein
MSSRNKAKGRINGPFVPLLKDTMKTEAWKALSHGARSLYVALKGRYNSKLQNAVWLSMREARQELGSHSHAESVQRWFRELQHYGFIVMVSPAHHGVNGHGKAPHWRLTEEGHLGKEPRRDFQRWDGSLFTEKRTRSRGRDGGHTLYHLGVTLVPEFRSEASESVTPGGHISEPNGVTPGGHITSQPLVTPARPDLRPSSGGPRPKKAAA